MSRPRLSAQPRQLHGKAVKRLRQQGMLPAVVYGNDRESQAIQVDAHEFELLRRRNGRNVLLDLTLDGGKPQPVLLHGIQEHPATRHTLHVDLLAVKMTEERTVDVPIVATGSSEAVERMGGVLLHLRDAVQVRALPDDLPQSVELDITPLDSFEAVLHASDLALPTGVMLITDPAEPVARVQPPRVEEAAVPAAEELEGLPAEVEEGAEETETAGEAGQAGQAGQGG
ncbi:MAG: 50S ribosomal protein L25 [Chloroflexota bacterium]|nr:50S ribosomal protein L25 [Chloroflexota bacterium]